MTSFDPATVRKAVAEFTPRRPQKFHDLIPAKDVIAELRQKRASYRSIAELLTQHCLPISKTAIAVFCHEVLGEIVRPRRRLVRRRPQDSLSGNNRETDSSEGYRVNAGAAEPTTDSNDGSSSRTRGPRIAQVRMAKAPTS